MNFSRPTIVLKKSKTYIVTEALISSTPSVRDVPYVTPTASAVVARTTSVVTVVVPVF